MFSYKDLLHELQLFNTHGVEVGSIGESTLGQRIPYIFVGQKNGNYMIVQSAIHAREHITALLCLCQAKYLVKNSDLLNLGGIYFIPMANPDGVRLCQEGVDFIDDEEQRRFLLELNGGRDFSLWKSNINGVDINVNFDANWGKGASNVFNPDKENYVGKCPESEAETQALVRFTLAVKPLVTLSYHCKGEVVYWKFNQATHRLCRDKRYADAIARSTGYTLIDGKGSTGGYKDWCIKMLKIPSYTSEVGSDTFEHPFPYSQFDNILKQNEDLPRRLLNSVVKDKQRLEKAGIDWTLSI